MSEDEGFLFDTGRFQRFPRFLCKKKPHYFDLTIMKKLCKGDNSRNLHR